MSSSKTKQKQNPNWILKSLLCKKLNFHSAVLFGLTKMFFQSSSLTEHSMSKHTSQLRYTAVFGLCHSYMVFGNIFPTVWSKLRPNTANPTAEMIDFKPNRGAINHQCCIMYYVTLFSIAFLWSEFFYFWPKPLILLGFVMPSLRGNVETSSVWLSRGTGPTCMCVEQARTTPSAPTWTEDAGHR